VSIDLAMGQYKVSGSGGWKSPAVSRGRAPVEEPKHFS